MKRGYEEVEACACGQGQLDKTHALLGCELTRVQLEPLRHEITRAFAVVAVAASRQERIAIEEVRREALPWSCGGGRL